MKGFYQNDKAMIHKILIANRGEIACRIIHTCQHLGIHTVAVYADVDTEAYHVQLADEAVYIGEAPAQSSYLRIEAIIAAAVRCGADAIHPGFGFLAENADFAQACAMAGLIFIGPSPAVIEAMGNKRTAKLLMAEASIPTIPGYSGADQSDEALSAVAANIGYPLMVKAAAGGGGKGMRLVQNMAELPAALAATRREGLQAFGSDELILERALQKPRHIEVQIFGDVHGNYLYLGERECSVQRRHQKVIEEAPAIGLTAAFRDKLGQTAVEVAQAIDYTNAGTVEFMVDGDGAYYFLEMNTRIQVEHPVTELVTGQDLVAWQIYIAEGQPLPLTQADVQLNGHAIEARLYAENPASGFLPVTGDIHLWRPPTGVGIRCDHGLRTQDSVSIFYDPMLAKVIAHGPDRQTAVRRLQWALAQTTLIGLVNNIAFLQAVLQHPAFQKGDLHTDFIAEHFPDWQQPTGNQTLALIVASISQYQQHPQLDHNRGYWRNSPNRPLLYHYQGYPEVALRPQKVGFHCQIGSEHYQISCYEQNGVDVVVTVEGHRQRAVVVQAESQWWVQTVKGVVALDSQPHLPKPQGNADTGGSLRAPMPGVILAVLVEVGQQVTKGDALLKLEAMKMEHTVRSAADGVVEVIYFDVGEQVVADAQLVKVGQPMPRS